MSALGDYYRAMAQEKIGSIPLQQEQALNLQSQRKLTEANAGEVAANAASARAAQGAQAGLVGTEAGAIRAKLPGEIDATAANTALTNQRASTLLPEALSQIGLQGAQTAATNATTQAGLTPLSSLNLSSLPGLADLLKPQQPGATSTNTSSVLQFHAKGTAKVKAGHKPSKKHATDTVPAMLSPGEAVLNRGAAEHMGRGVIEHMNKLGLMRMAAQHEIGKHTAKMAKHTGSAAKPKAGSVMHFLTGTDDVHAAPAALAMLPQLAAMMAGGGKTKKAAARK